jgi:hypothetical protein
MTMESVNYFLSVMKDADPFNTYHRHKQSYRQQEKSGSVEAAETSSAFHTTSLRLLETAKQTLN